MPEYESKYESRFYYIEDDNKRKHMGDALEFITELLSISKNFSEENKNYYYKTCILYTASLIEAHIHYCILKLGFTQYTSDEYTYKNIRLIHTCEDDFCVLSCKRKKEVININGHIDFNVLNGFAYKTANIYNENIFNKIDKIRKLRNKIHLMKLEDIDRKYTKIQVNDTFETARELFKIIENKLTIH